jgi:hypothetical protein
MLTLNNPLVLVSAKVLGVGIELRLEHVDGVRKICFQVDAIAWSYCKEW